MDELILFDAGSSGIGVVVFSFWNARTAALIAETGEVLASWWWFKQYTVSRFVFFMLSLFIFSSQSVVVRG